MGIKENKKQKIYEKKWFAIGLIILVSFLVYANSLKNEFAYDDNDQILGNQYIRNVKYIGKLFTSTVFSYKGLDKVNYYRPIQFSTYMINYHIFGFNSFIFHLTSIIFHIFTAIIFFLIAKYLLKSALGAILAAILFVTHPMHTESVAWISASNDVICTLFYLISFYFHIKFIEEKPKHKIFLIFGSLFCFTLALFSKEMAVTLPFILISYNLINNEKVNLQYFVPYFIILFLYSFVRNRALGEFAPLVRYEELNSFQLVFNTFPLMAKYLLKLLFPFKFNAFYIFYPVFTILNSKVLFSLLVIVIIIVFSMLMRKKKPLVTLSIFWIFITIAPVLYIRGLGENVFCERYLYLPSVGFCLLMAYLITKLGETKPGIWIAVVLILTFYSYKTVKRNIDWKDDYSLWVKTVRTSPSVVVHFNFAGGCYKRKLYEEAIPELKWVIKAAPNLLLPHFMLGSIYTKKGWWDKAEVEYKKVIEIDPAYSKAHYNLGNCYSEKGLYEQAIAEYKKEIEVNSDYAKAHYNLGQIYHKKGWLESAIAEYKEALKIDPNFVEAHSNLGVIYVTNGWYDRAIEEFKLALHLEPNSVQMQKNLESAYKVRKMHEANSVY